MEYTTLGQTNIKVSRICLGTMTWGSQNTEAEGHQQMDYALAEGVNFWDTAEMYAVPPSAETYGTTETIIGTWLKNRGKRDEIILASKISPELPYIREGGTEIDRKNIKLAIEDSLKRLQTDYIDLYQLHWPTNRNTYHFNNGWSYKPKSTDKAVILANQLEVLETLNELIKEGKIRHFGLSNDSAWGLTRYCALAEQHNLPKPVSVQNEYSILRRRDDTDVAESCMIEGVSYLPWSPLAMGVATGKYLKGASPTNARLTHNETAKTRYSYRLTETVEKATTGYASIARNIGVEPAQLALAFCLSRSFVTSPIIGATTMEQLKTNIDAINLKLDEETLNAINKIHKAYPVPF